MRVIAAAKPPQYDVPVLPPARPNLPISPSLTQRDHRAAFHRNLIKLPSGVDEPYPLAIRRKEWLTRAIRAPKFRRLVLVEPARKKPNGPAVRVRGGIDQASPIRRDDDTVHSEAGDWSQGDILPEVDIQADQRLFGGAGSAPPAEARARGNKSHQRRDRCHRPRQ